MNDLEPLKCGWLQKKNTMRWSRRYFVLTRSTLAYYSSEDTRQAPKQMFALLNSRLIPPPSGSKAHSWIFKGWCQTSKCHEDLSFCAGDQIDFDAWTARLKHAIAARNAVGQTPPQPPAVHQPTVQNRVQPRRHLVQVRCPNAACKKVVAPPAGTPRCRCPYCRQVMAIPEREQRLLLQQQQQDQQAAQQQQTVGPPQVVAPLQGSGAAATNEQQRRRALQAQARQRNLQNQRRQMQQQQQILVRCPHCMRAVRPPNVPICQCPHCYQRMQVPQTVREALTLREQQQRERQQQQAAQQAEQQDYMYSLELPDLKDSETQRMWVKKIIVAQNKVIWMPNVNESADEPAAAGGRVNSNGGEQDRWEAIRKKGWTRSMLSPAGITWTPAEEGYQLVLDKARHGISLDELQQIAGLNFKEKRKWFLTKMAGLRTKWEDGHQKIKVKRSNLLEDAHRKFRLPRLTRPPLCPRLFRSLVSPHMSHACRSVHAAQDAEGALADLSVRVRGRGGTRCRRCCPRVL